MKGQANVLAAIGATGSGKSLWVRRTYLAKSIARLAVWDFKREYSDLVAASTSSSRDLVGQVRERSFTIAFTPAMEEKKRDAQFDVFCRACYQAGKMTMLVEELAFVTRPGYAPSAWRMMTLTGRHEGMTIIGTSQRPASIDKDFLSSCTLIHCGRLPLEADARAVATVLGIDWRELVTLPDLHYIERRTGALACTRGVLDLQQNTAKKPQSSKSAPRKVTVTKKISTVLPAPKAIV